MPKPHSSSAATRQRLIEAAARKFAQNGFRAVSIRDIASAAEVNPALINYHFGGKEGIFEEVIRASAADHVAQRMHDLTRARANGARIDLEGLLRIYLQPLLNKKKWSSEEANFARLHASLINERSDVAEEIAARAFNTVNIAFIDEIGGSLEETQPYTEGRVVWDANIITSRGPGTALEWSLCCVEAIFGRAKALEVAGPMVTRNPRRCPRSGPSSGDWRRRSPRASTERWKNTRTEGWRDDGHRQYAN